SRDLRLGLILTRWLWKRVDDAIGVLAERPSVGAIETSAARVGCRGNSSTAVSHHARRGERGEHLHALKRSRARSILGWRRRWRGRRRQHLRQENQSTALLVLVLAHAHSARWRGVAASTTRSPMYVSGLPRPTRTRSARARSRARCLTIASTSRRLAASCATNSSSFAPPLFTRLTMRSSESAPESVIIRDS